MPVTVARPRRWSLRALWSAGSAALARDRSTSGPTPDPTRQPPNPGPAPVRAFSAAQLALGERMYAAGIDDGETGERIVMIEAELRALAATADEHVRAGLREVRERLVRFLADQALVDDAPLPGADAEYEAARGALTALNTAPSGRGEDE